MSKIAIRVDSLSKEYKISRVNGRYDTLRDAMAAMGSRLLSGFHTPNPQHATPNVSPLCRGREGGIETGKTVIRNPPSETFWALKDVSFEVKRGEVVGIIGRNGAGKSTLLKILSRITEPTRGRAEIYGRMGSLLEVGTGFHPELTGRENIYLNGAILGMRKEEIKRKFDEIVAFAEVERFIETPVKHYSSGMYVRLAFAVAAHLETEILVVDEVLAVGDATFQKQCLGKMGAVAKEGRTVLFVSHNMGVVSKLCETAHWLESGELKKSGRSRVTVQDYLIQSTSCATKLTYLSGLKRAPGVGDKLRIQAIEWLTDLPLRHGEAVAVRIEFRSFSAVDDVTMGLGFSTLEGSRLLTYETDFQEGHRPQLIQRETVVVDLKIEDFPLAPGIYSIDIGSRSGDMYPLDYLQGFAQVEVVPGHHTPSYIVRNGAGVRLPAEWNWHNS